MTAKEELRRLVDGLSDDEASRLLSEFRYASAEVDSEPLTTEERAALERGAEDIRAGRTKTLDQYERERGL